MNIKTISLITLAMLVSTSLHPDSSTESFKRGLQKENKRQQEIGRFPQHTYIAANCIDKLENNIFTTIKETYQASKNNTNEPDKYEEVKDNMRANIIRDLKTVEAVGECYLLWKIAKNAYNYCAGNQNAPAAQGQPAQAAAAQGQPAQGQAQRNIFTVISTCILYVFLADCAAKATTLTLLGITN